MPGRLWMDVWNNIVRYKIFGDEKLMKLMQLDEDVTIMEFLENYFIKAGFISTVLFNEPVRITYGNVTVDPSTAYVTINQMSFDIYVKSSELHNAERDRLVYRTELIAQRLQEILIDEAKDTGYKFRIIFEGDKSTSMIGYARYNVTFEYKRTY